VRLGVQGGPARGQTRSLPDRGKGQVEQLRAAPRRREPISLTALHLLENVIDIYMPDMKYASAQVGLQYSKIRDYPQINQAAVKEMHRQVGDLQINEEGLAERGLLVRHLVLPNGLAGSEEILRFIAEEISKNTYVNLMNQYRPAHHALQFPELNRPITSSEYQAALQVAQTVGLNRLNALFP